MNINIMGRLENLGTLALTAAIDVPIDTAEIVYGVAMSALCVFTLGLSKRVNSVACYTGHADNILPTLYGCTVKVINPDANFVHPSVMRTARNCSMGFLTELAASPIFEKAGELSRAEDSFIKRHVFSRLVFGAGVVVATVTRIADFAFGLIATALSLVTLGTVPMINAIAYRQLNVLGLVNDVCYGICSVVNPQRRFAVSLPVSV